MVVEKWNSYKNETRFCTLHNLAPPPEFAAINSVDQQSDLGQVRREMLSYCPATKAIAMLIPGVNGCRLYVTLKLSGSTT